MPDRKYLARTVRARYYFFTMKTIGIIPARGKSESVPHKPIRPFCGKPLIEWTIRAAKKSGALDRVIVLTDSPKIAEVARACGAEVPFFEPAGLAAGIGGIELPLRFVYEKLKEREGYAADRIMMLMPTNPLRQPFHMREAIRLFDAAAADSVVSMNETPANYTPYWTFVKHEKEGARLWGGKRVKHIIDRRQDFPERCWARNELIYLLKPENLYAKPPRLYGKKMHIYETNPIYEMDINTPDEWRMAELRFKYLRRHLHEIEDGGGNAAA